MTTTKTREIIEQRGLRSARLRPWRWLLLGAVGLFGLTWVVWDHAMNSADIYRCRALGNGQTWEQHGPCPLASLESYREVNQAWNTLAIMVTACFWIVLIVGLVGLIVQAFRYPKYRAV